MMRIVLDTNVLISACHFGGKPLDILHLVRSEQVELYISEFICQETEGILQKKFLWKEKEIKRVLGLIHRYAKVVQPQQTITVIQDNKDDNRILECAKAAQADFLITGDVLHLQSLKQYGKIEIISPAEFLRLWQNVEL